MSERASKRSRNAEPYASKRLPPSKRRRKASARKAAKRKIVTAELASTPTTSTSAEPPIKFAVRVEVESCDEDWWYEETQSKQVEDVIDWKVEGPTEEDSTVSKSLQSNRNHSDDKTEKLNKFKFAYLEALNQSSLLEKLEGNPCHVRGQSVTGHLESLTCPTNKTEEKLLDYSCIKKEVLNKAEDLDEVDTSENLTEYLGITIKEEPLPDAIEENEELTFTSLLCLEQESVRTVKSWDTDDDNEENGVNDTLNHNNSGNNTARCASKNTEPLRRYDVNSTSYVPIKTELEQDCVTEIPLWHISSRYFDMAISKAVDSLKDLTGTGLTFNCGLCSQTFSSLQGGSHAIETCVEDIRTHLNYSHLNHTLILNAVPSAGEGKPCTIVAEKVDDTEEKYVEIRTAAHKDLLLMRTCLRSIVYCLTKKRQRRFLSYKCYLCKLCYEHLEHYVDHLKTFHATRPDWPMLTVTTELAPYAYLNVIAIISRPSSYEDFAVITDESSAPTFKCLKCKLDFGDNKAAYIEHRNGKLKCSGCKRSLKCHNMYPHIGMCRAYFEYFYPKTCPCKEVFHSERELDKHQLTCPHSSATLAFNCLVCGFVTASLANLVDHQKCAHTVRSDEFVFDDVYNYRFARNSATTKTMPEKQTQSSDEATASATKQPSQSTRQHSRIELRNSSCPYCPYKRKKRGQSLAAHLANNHLVRSDTLVTSAFSCTWCNSHHAYSEKTFHQHLLYSHGVNIRVNINAFNTTFCLVCGTNFMDGLSLYTHLIRHHFVRSDQPIYQEVTRCSTCFQLYPGPAVSHYCVEEMDRIGCNFCRRQFRNNLFLSCHINAQHPVTCANCKTQLLKGCMLPRHEVECKGTHMIVLECLNCGFKEEPEDDSENSAMDAHCFSCFTSVEKYNNVFFTREVIIPKIAVSDDARYDHTYGSIAPSVTEESSELGTEIVTMNPDTILDETTYANGEKVVVGVNEKEMSTMVTDKEAGAPTVIEKDNIGNDEPIHGKEICTKRDLDSTAKTMLKATAASSEKDHTLEQEKPKTKRIIVPESMIKYIAELEYKSQQTERKRKRIAVLNDEEREKGRLQGRLRVRLLIQRRKRREPENLIVPMPGVSDDSKVHDSFGIKPLPTASDELVKLAEKNVTNNFEEKCVPGNSAEKFVTSNSAEKTVTNNSDNSQTERNSSQKEVNYDLFVIGKETLQQLMVESKATDVIDGPNGEATTGPNGEATTVTVKSSVCEHDNNIVDVDAKASEEGEGEGVPKIDGNEVRHNEVVPKIDGNEVCHNEGVHKIDGNEVCHNEGVHKIDGNEVCHNEGVHKINGNEVCQNEGVHKIDGNEVCHNEGVHKIDGNEVCHNEGVHKIDGNEVCHNEGVHKIDGNEVCHNEGVHKIDGNEVCHNEEVPKVDEKDNDFRHSNEEEVSKVGEEDAATNICRNNETLLSKAYEEGNNTNVCNDSEKIGSESDRIAKSCNKTVEIESKVDDKNNVTNTCLSSEKESCKVDKQDPPKDIDLNVKDVVATLNDRTTNACHINEKMTSGVEEQDNNKKERVFNLIETGNVSNVFKEESSSSLEEGNVFEVIKQSDTAMFKATPAHKTDVNRSTIKEETNESMKNTKKELKELMVTGNLSDLGPFKIETVESMAKIKTEPQIKPSEKLLMKIKSEPIDAVDEFVVTNYAEVDAELSVEYFIENNAEISDPEMAESDETGSELALDEIVRKKKKRKHRNRKLYACRICPYTGYHRDFRAHKTVCRSKKELLVNLPLPYNCLDYCRSFTCFTCQVEFTSMEEYYTHNCRRKGHCPCCNTHYKTLSFLKGHCQTVIRRLYSTVAGDKLNIFNCVQCGESVVTAEVFNHWAKHRSSGHGKRLKAKTYEVKNEQNYDEAYLPTTDDSSDYALSEIKMKKELVVDQIKTENISGDDVSEPQYINQPEYGSQSVDGFPDAPLTPEELKELLEIIQMPLKRSRWRGPCIVCAKYCSRNREFKIHLIQHLLRHAFFKKNVLGALCCQLCPERFSNAADFKNHMRNHAGLPLYACPRCDKSFSDSSNLAKHKKVHNMEVKICDICKRKFSCKAMLVKHLEMHAISEPQQCPLCPSIFYYASELRKHMKGRHRTEKQNYSCKFCLARLPTIKFKWEHEWLVHGERKTSADCDVCGEKFRRISDVRKHMRTEHSTGGSYPDQRLSADKRLQKLLTELAMYKVKSERVDQMVAEEIGGAALRVREILEREVRCRSQGENSGVLTGSGLDGVSRTVDSENESVSHMVHNESVSQNVHSESESMSHMINSESGFVSHMVNSDSVSQIVDSESLSVSQMDHNESMRQNVNSDSESVSHMINSESVSQNVKSESKSVNLKIKRENGYVSPIVNSKSGKRLGSMKRPIKKKPNLLRRTIKSKTQSVLRMVRKQKKDIDASRMTKKDTKATGQTDNGDIEPIRQFSMNTTEVPTGHAIQMINRSNAAAARSNTGSLIRLVSKSTELAAPTAKKETKCSASKKTVEVAQTVKADTEYVSKVVRDLKIAKMDSGTANSETRVEQGTENADQRAKSDTEGVSQILRKRQSLTIVAECVSRSHTVKSGTVFVSPPVKSGTVFVSPPVKSGTVFVSPPVKSGTVFVSPPVKSGTVFVSPPVKNDTVFVSPPVKNDTVFVSPNVKSDTAVMARFFRIAPDNVNKTVKGASNKCDLAGQKPTCSSASQNQGLNADFFEVKRPKVRWSYLRKSTKCKDKSKS